MVVDVFAGIHVRDYEIAKAWYTQLFGGEPSFVAHDTECVWEVAAHAWVYIEESPGHAGHSVVTLFLDDLDAEVAAISARGIEPAHRETYGDGVRKVLYHDPDGNEIGLGGAPTDAD